jgi:hypothetical protein
MSTRSRIGLLLEDGTIHSVYHHWDSYPERLGVKLLGNYNTEEAVKDLIAGGDISTTMSHLTWDGVSVNEEIVLYYTDRGDAGVDPTIAEDDQEYYRQTSDCGGEYAYVFDPTVSEWFCYDMHTKTFINLYNDVLTETPLAV